MVPPEGGAAVHLALGLDVLHVVEVGSMLDVFGDEDVEGGGVELLGTVVGFVNAPVALLHALEQ